MKIRDKVYSPLSLTPAFSVKWTLFTSRSTYTTGQHTKTTGHKGKTVGVSNYIEEVDGARQKKGPLSVPSIASDSFFFRTIRQLKPARRLKNTVFQTNKIVTETPKDKIMQPFIFKTSRNLSYTKPPCQKHHATSKNLIITKLCRRKQ